MACAPASRWWAVPQLQCEISRQTVNDEMVTVTHEPAQGGLAPPRFSLQTFLVAIGALAFLMAVFRIAGPNFGIPAVFLLVLVAAHVLGNALGTRLRESRRGDASRGTEQDDGPPRGMGRFDPSAARPATLLSEHQSHGWFLLVVSCFGGATAAFLTANYLPRWYSQPISRQTYLFACLAVGLLAAAVSFWVFGLARVFSAAWWQAHRGDRQG